MSIGEMLTMYELSYFAGRDFVPVDRIASPAEQARALAEYIADPLRVIQENVDQSRQDVAETTARMRLAREDGLLDRDVYRQATDAERTRWRAAVKMLKGDHARAVAELAHWREYAGEAIAGRLPMPKGKTFKEIARDLADAKSIEPDRRLPPEAEDTF